MKRTTVRKRKNWDKKFEELGFSFHSIDGVYWNEGICYQFSSDEIDHIEEVTAELNHICMNAVEYVIEKNLFSKLMIDERFAKLVKKSWGREDISIYGRFDFSYNGADEPKLLEYNADTPTSLVESSIAQWVWLEDTFPHYDQFNSIHEKLIESFKYIAKNIPENTPFYFSSVNKHQEDFVTVEYIRDTAIRAGLDGRHISIEDIGFSNETGCFYHLSNNLIEFIFKLYPWEWLINDEFGNYILNETAHFFEPPWKMVLSNKGILPILWEMYPNHPNLLPSYFEEGKINGRYIRKPLFSREGANISFVDGYKSISTEGTYGSEGYIYQQPKELPCFEGNYALVGSWVVNGEPAGIGIREDDSVITKNTSKFVPHFFKP